MGISVAIGDPLSLDDLRGLGALVPGDGTTGDGTTGDGTTGDGTTGGDTTAPPVLPVTAVPDEC